MPSETILSLPFAYEARFVRPKHRNTSTALVRDTIPVSVPVATSDEAPVAFVLDWSNRRGEKVEPLVTRSFEGRLFRAIVDNGNAPVPMAAFETDVNRAGGDWRATWFPSSADRPTWSGDQYPELPPLKRSEYGRRNPMRLMDLEELAEDVAEQVSKFRLKGTDRTERAAEAQGFLSENLVCIDGGMWTSNYAVEPAWGVYNGRVSFGVGKDDLWYVTRFRLDRLDEAVALAEAQGGSPPDLSDIPAVTIPDAGLLSHDDGIMLAKQLRSGMGWHWDSVSKREGWGPEAESMRETLDFWCRGEMGLREAGSLLEGFGKLRDMLATMPADRYPGSAEIVERTGPALARWAVERESRADMTALAMSAEDDELAFATLSP